MGALATTEAEEPRVAVSGTGDPEHPRRYHRPAGPRAGHEFRHQRALRPPPRDRGSRRRRDRPGRDLPRHDAEDLERRFTSDSRFIWLRRYISPEQEQMVHDLGEPGLLFGPREMRLYPNGAIAAHILGGAGFGQEAVNAAEWLASPVSRRSSTTACAIRPAKSRWRFRST
jgi:cell division protein FtsI (penicillin-binding protein 3)